MLMKFCPKCHVIIMQSKSYCDKCQVTVDTAKAERKTISNAKAGKRYNQTKRNPAYVSFYHSTEWKTLRAVKLSQSSYLCQDCKAKGVITLAADVHHIETISEAWDKRLDINNLKCLCIECHNKAHGRWGKENKDNATKARDPRVIYED